MRILLLTTLYSIPGERILNNTNVCGSFAKEWVKMGHEVRVVYQYTIYHKVFHWIAKRYAKQIAGRLYGAVPTQRISDIGRYNVDGVEVIRIPIYKTAPRLLYSDRAIQEHFKKIVQINNEDSFMPDVVIGHFFYPNIQLVAQLKTIYPHSKTCVVVHLQGINIEKTKKHLDKIAPDAIKTIDEWGYRSKPIQRYFEKAYGHFDNFFYCYSGIPSSFLTKNKPEKDFSEIKRFVYVGALIKRKHPIELLLALKKSIITDFAIEYVGDGQQRHAIREFARKHDLIENVHINGFVQRDSVAIYLDKSQVFVMISERETFGLVYIEAMARGCIVIASRNEGMEGIVQDGVNGFLCNAGDSKELTMIFNKISRMPKDELIKVSDNAYETAMNLTDEKVAERYLFAITGRRNAK